MEDYLNNSIQKYLEKLSNNDFKISNEDIDIIFIDELDNITDMFLKSKDEYSIKEQRKYLIKISLLYLLVVKDNINNLFESDLEESYFKDNLKSIILNIYALYDIGIIKNIPQINFTEELSVSDLISIIDNSEFNTIEERHKTIIKTKFNEFFIH